jgi:hypothetical protein
MQLWNYDYGPDIPVWPARFVAEAALVRLAIFKNGPTPTNAKKRNNPLTANPIQAPLPKTY